MSINHFLNKIKGVLPFDRSYIVYFLVIVGVAISSFSLGRMSYIYDNEENKQEIKYSQFENLNNIENEEKIKEGIGESFSTTSLEEKKYVASKNGKLYYSLGCSGAGRIKEENKVWFSSKEEAEKSGYEPSTSCK